MGDYKKVKREKQPDGRRVKNCENPNEYYNKNPAWNFHTCDKEQWSLSQERIGDNIWKEIIPHLMAFETNTWQTILGDKTHAIDISGLNKDAQQRLIKLKIEAESLVSLRLTGTHRIYGYMNNAVYNVLWYDDNHGDNDKCVCRSKKKHS